MDAATIFYLIATVFTCIMFLYWLFSDIRLAKANAQLYVWYKRASVICCFAYLFLVASHYILTVFFPNNLLWQMISIAISLCVIAVVGYRSWLGFREKKPQEQVPG